jgi:hypothetical protein
LDLSKPSFLDTAQKALLLPSVLIHAPPAVAGSDSTCLGSRVAGGLEPWNGRFNARPNFLVAGKHFWISLTKRI